MSPQPAKFTLADLRRALKAAHEMGLTVTGYTIEPKKISVTTGTADNAAANPLIQRLRLVKA
jgi:hypothetical protein